MAKVDVKALGLTCGIIWGGCCLFMGLAAMISGWCDVMVAVFSSLYIGYAPTISGTLIGTLWGFGDGFIGGILIAFLYNKLAK